jgi:hypothetical protein
MTSSSTVREADDTLSTVVGPTNIPGEIRRLTPLANLDYADMFTVTTSAAKDKSPEEWARAGFEETPIARRFASVAWGILGLRLGPRHSPDYVHGWKIADRGEDWIRIETASWYMPTHLVLYRDDRQASLVLFVRYDRPIAKLIWPLFAPGHRLAGSRLMAQVVRTRRRTV